MKASSVQWPTFLGIGVPKAATTWLYEVLDNHPDIWMPEHEREVHFFNRYYGDRGLDWYGQFFPSREEPTYQAIGEVTPSYLYCEEERIEAIASEVPSVQKLILMLRNPVDRLYSGYWFSRRVDNLDVTFREFMEERPTTLRWGRYAVHLKRWLQYFDREQFLVLTVESDLADVEHARKRLASFLGVDPTAFPPGAGKSEKNARYMPKFRRLYAWAVDLNRKMKRANIYWPAKIADALGVKHWFGKKTIDRKMDPKIREELTQFYADDVEKLEQLLGREFSEWKDFASSSGH